MIKSLTLLKGSIILFLGSLSFDLSSQTITGKVTSSDDGLELPGVTVQVKGTSRGVITDIEGTYTLNLEDGDEVLVFSYIGFETQEVVIGGQNIIDIALSSGISELEEVVVVGYGELRKRDLTGAVASLKDEELEKAVGANPLQALQGKVAGLQVLSGSGQPGSEPNIRLRGIGTLNDNRALFVIDGIITEQTGAINSQDIESVEVLKDASSKAIYGTRGANGVIIITTKKGKGEAQIRLNAEYSVEKVANPLELMNGREFATYINAVNPGTYNNLDILPNTDWQELIFKDWKPIQSYQLSASGSSDKMNYYISGGYYGQEGIIEKSDFDRFTFKLNTSYDINKAIKIGTNLTAASGKRQNPPGVLNAAYRAWPINEPFIEDPGQINNLNRGFANVMGSNPLATIEFSNSESSELRALGNMYLELTFLKNFKFRPSYQFEVSNTKTRNFAPAFEVSPTQLNEESDISVTFAETRSWIFENTISYNKRFDDHRIDAVIGYTIQEDNNEFINGSRQNVLSEAEELQFLNGALADNQLNSNSAGSRTLESILFRANYVFKDRYIFTATYRRDGSSNFGINNRYADFPALALGWNISEESFFPKSTILSFAKLRASWGINGNEKITSGETVSQIGTGIGAVFGQSETLVGGATFVGRPGNASLRWEETTEIDLGLEFALFDDRLNGEIDYYNKKTNDILVDLLPAGYLGAGAFQEIRVNAADSRNTGIEWVLNWRDQVGNISYGLGITGNTISNTVEGLGEEIGVTDQIIAGNLGNGQNVTRTRIGDPIGHFYGYKVIGVFQNEDQLNSTPSLSASRVGDFIYADLNNDNQITDADRTQIGSWIPELVYGFNFFVAYKGVELSLDFAGQYGNEIYNGKQAIRFATLNFEDRFLNYWTGEGSTNEFPRPSLSGVNFNPSDYFIEDASFLKLRTITLSYSLPQSIVEKLSFNSISAFVRGTNLWISTDYSGYTPEIGSGNSALGGIVDLNVYPVTKVLTLGIRATL